MIVELWIMVNQFDMIAHCPNQNDDDLNYCAIVVVVHRLLVLSHGQMEIQLASTLIVRCRCLQKKNGNKRNKRRKMKTTNQMNCYFVADGYFRFLPSDLLYDIEHQYAN